MKIINLTNFTEITDENQPKHAVRAMFIHQTDESGAPVIYEIKDWYPETEPTNE